MDTFHAEPAPPHLPQPSVNGNPCGLDCSFATPLRHGPYDESWLWCVHPHNSHRVVSCGHDCPRYTPREND